MDIRATGRVSRVEMLRSAGALGVSTRVVPRRSAAAEVLTCIEWGGYDSPDYIQPYVTKYGAQPNFSIFAGEEDALAKVLAGFAADVMHPCNYSVARFVNAGVAKEIDTARLSHWADVFPALQSAEGVVMDGKVVMAPADWGNAAIAYRPDLMPPEFAADPTWAIFYEDEYAGRVSMTDNEMAIVIGAMVGGMPSSSFCARMRLRGPVATCSTGLGGREAVATSAMTAGCSSPTTGVKCASSHWPNEPM